MKALAGLNHDQVGEEQIMNKAIDKASILVEALPYIQAFKDKIFVIKYGGSAMEDETLKNQVLTEIALLKSVGILPVIIHGGGKDISKILKEVDKPSTFVDGIRKTTDSEMGYVEMTLSGKLNKEITGILNQTGCSAVGISGRDANCIKAKMLYPDNPDFSRVGCVKSVDVKLIHSLIASDFVPVISPVGMGENGTAMNINADEVASAVASALNAEKLILITDVDGVLNEGKLITQLTGFEAQELIQKGIITGGMIPKIQSSLNSHISNVHILNGTTPRALLLEIFTHEGIGTKIILNDTLPLKAQ